MPLRSTPGYGGHDGNPLTLYGNGGGTNASPLNFNRPFKTFAYTAALDYAFSDSCALYGRYSKGRKSPDLTCFFALNTSFLIAAFHAFSQKTEQAELGFKVKTSKLSGAVTPFYRQLSNVAPVQALTNVDNTTSTPPVQFARCRTYGILGWPGPGGFPAALDRQAFTPQSVQDNPHAVYATQGPMPRAYFLSAVYKF